MSTAQEKILLFMRALDNTNLSGAAAVNEAVRACSSFSSASEWISSFITKAGEYYSDSNKAGIYGFLQDVCNINLTNEDTGAITGSDAKATSTQKTVDTVVPISGSAVYPTSSTSVFDGLTVHWPTSVTTETEKLMIQGLNSWWIKGALDLIKESYGMDFTESGTTVHDINVKLCYGDDTKISGSTGDYFLAQVVYYYNNGDKTISRTMELNINMDAYAALSSTDTHGETSTSGVDPSLDRLLAHELTHAVMVANDNYFYKLPLFVSEGLAELTSGTDDRLGLYMSLLTSMDTSVDISGILTSALNLNSRAYTGITPYLAGYAALRYLAAYQSDLSPSVYASTSTLSYNPNQTTLTVGAGYSGDLWLGRTVGMACAPTVTTLDASSADGDVHLSGNYNSNTIIGGSGTNNMWGGSSANDILEGGSGVNTFWYGVNDGNDTVTNFTSGKDTFFLYTGNLRGNTFSGNDLILSVGDSSTTTGTLTIKDGIDRKISMNLMGTDREAYYAGKNQDETVTWSKDINYYYSSDAYTNTIKVTGGNDATVRMDNASTVLYYGFRHIDASASSGSNILTGTTDSDIIYTGTGHSEIWGGFGGNDVFQLGSGSDRVGYGLTDGNDTIVDGTASDSVFFYDIINISYIAFSLQGTTLKGTTASGSSFYIQNWSASGLNTFETSDNMKYSLSLVNGDLHILDKA